MIDDVLNGIEVLRVGDYRWLNRVLIPIPVSAAAYYFYFHIFHGGFHNMLLSENASILLAAAIVINMIAILMYIIVKYLDQRYGHVAYYLFDFDRWKLYPTMVLE